MSAAAKKQVLPLAVVPVPSNDVLPRATTVLPNAVQRLSFGRTRIVKTEVKRRRRFEEYAVVEKALFPRLLWAVVGESFDQDDPDSLRILRDLRADIEVWAELMLPGQRMDFERELNNAYRAMLEPMLNRGIGDAGGWHTIKVLMVFMLLVKWVDQHAIDPMFTTDFARLAQEVLTHIDKLYGDECDAVEPSAHRMLGKVIARVKQCGLFGWLPDYRSDDHG